MNTIPHLKLYSKEELYCLLSACSDYLALAYTTIHEQHLSHLSTQASFACESLRYEIDIQNKNHVTH